MRQGRMTALGVALAALLATELAGQGMSARIVGNVRNEDSLPLGGVLVTAVNTINNSSITAVSGEPDGSFRLLGLAPGIYQVSFDLEGYESYTAAGISLSVEQSVTLRVKLKRDKASVAPAATTPAAEKIRFFDLRGKFSFQVSLGVSHMEGGDINEYLRGFSQRVAYVQQPFEFLRWGTDVNGELALRITPRFELAAGVGLVQGRRWNNKLTSVPPASAAASVERYMVCLNVRTIPLALGCRYWINARGRILLSVAAAAQYHFARWRMDTEYSHDLLIGQSLPLNATYESAAGNGLGWAAGGRAEVKIDKHYSLIAEFSGRWAPVHNFSGRRVFFPATVMSKPEITDGELWFFESYDRELGRWVRRLEVGVRPGGDEVRNIANTTVNFSGLSLRVGILFWI